jgi:hypothetical protein
MNKNIYSNILKGHSQEKSLSTKHVGRCLWPQIWTAELFKIFLVIPLKVRTFETFIFTL